MAERAAPRFVPGGSRARSARIRHRDPGELNLGLGWRGHGSDPAPSGSGSRGEPSAPGAARPGALTSTLKYCSAPQTAAHRIQSNVCKQAAPERCTKRSRLPEPRASKTIVDCAPATHSSRRLPPASRPRASFPKTPAGKGPQVHRAGESRPALGAREQRRQLSGGPRSPSPAESRAPAPRRVRPARPPPPAPAPAEGPRLRASRRCLSVPPLGAPSRTFIRNLHNSASCFPLGPLAPVLRARTARSHSQTRARTNMHTSAHPRARTRTHPARRARARFSKETAGAASTAPRPGGSQLATGTVDAGEVVNRHPARHPGGQALPPRRGPGSTCTALAPSPGSLAAAGKWGRWASEERAEVAGEAEFGKTETQVRASRLSGSPD